MLKQTKKEKHNNNVAYISANCEKKKMKANFKSHLCL